MLLEAVRENTDKIGKMGVAAQGVVGLIETSRHPMSPNGKLEVSKLHVLAQSLQ